jgi:hypothetical protein
MKYVLEIVRSGTTAGARNLGMNDMRSSGDGSEQAISMIDLTSE